MSGEIICLQAYPPTFGDSNSETQTQEKSNYLKEGVSQPNGGRGSLGDKGHNSFSNVKVYDCQKLNGLLKLERKTVYHFFTHSVSLALRACAHMNNKEGPTLGKDAK